MCFIHSIFDYYTFHQTTTTTTTTNLFITQFLYHCVCLTNSTYLFAYFCIVFLCLFKPTMKTTSSKTTRKKCQLMTNQIKNSYNIQTNNLITIKPIENIYEIKAKQKKNGAHCLILCDCNSSNQTV